MTYGAFILIIVLSTCTAALFSYAVHRLVHVDTRKRHQEASSAVFLQLGVLVAVLLAFVFNEAYAEYGDAQQAIDLECGALHATAMLVSTLPPAEARDLLGLEADYIRDVIQYDWPEMAAHHRGSPKAVADLTELVQHAARLPIASPADIPVKAQILDLLSTAHAQREVRLYQAQNGLPVVLWIVLIAFSVLLMVFVTFSGVEDVFWLIMFVVTFATCISAILCVVSLLNYPFQGALALNPGDFQARLANIADILIAVGRP